MERLEDNDDQEVDESLRSALRTWGDRWRALRPNPVARRGQGAVWRVRDLRDSTRRGPRPTYALKEMLSQRPRTSTAYRRFVQEIETTSRLARSHTGIVQVVDQWLPLDDELGIPFFVMPWADATLERARFLAGPDALERVLRIGMQIADALGACHAESPVVIHRDVKPANVLLMGDTLDPQLADFGICFLEHEDRDRLTDTEAGTIGSIGFTAPELLGGGKIDEVGASVDIYSLGKTLYAVAAGGDLFPRESHRMERFDLARRYDDARLEHLHGLLDCMVIEDPSRRYAAMEQCREQLGRAISNLQRGIPYVRGMYGGGEQPLERRASLHVALQSAPGLTRSDAVHDAVDRCFRAAEARAEEFEGANQRMSSPVGQPHAGGLVAASEVAEELLSVALPLVQADERDHFEEWLGRARTMSQRDDYRFAPRRQVTASGAVAAIYGAAAAGWLLRRDAAMAMLVAAHLEADRDWIHLELLDRSAGRLLPWIHTVLTESPVLRASLDRTADDIANAANVFPGLVAIRDLQLSPPDVQALVDAGRVDEITMPAYPMCYFEGATWATTLAGTCVHSKPRERSLGEQVFELSSERFRDLCRRITPVLAAWTNRLNREISRNVSWRFTVDGEGVWNRWCGGETRATS